MQNTFSPVKPELVGEAVYATKPGSDPHLYGTATMSGPESVEARTYQTFKIRYTTGKLGIDDTGAIRIAFRFISDAGTLQMTNPAAPNYVTATSSGEGRLEIRYDRNGGQRPWNEVLTIYQRGGYLRPGETIDITIGNTSAGSPGMLLPTFIDNGRIFRVMADVQATGVFIPLPENQLSVNVIGGPLHRHLAVLPTMRRPGETFHLGVKAEDIWGNPTGQGSRQFSVSSTMPVAGLPDTIAFDAEDGSVVIENLSCDTEGRLVVTLRDENGVEIKSGPLAVRKGAVAHFWGDLHAQTGETVGNNSAEYYFDFARNKAFLDVTSHQANDFQINATFWKHLNELTARKNEPGRFTVLPGYEWSGNTAVGGDHNVFYANEGATIYRCSHALVDDRSDEANDAHTLTDLYTKLRQEPTDAVMYAHVGGRYANIFYDHDANIEAAVEVHSAWGTFEWLLTDGFQMRRRVGVVCNSDDHKGRPGASFPGASVFGAYGGLTCFVTDQNNRASIFETIRRRHTYGTTGPRVLIDLKAAVPEGSTLYHRNPLIAPQTTFEQVSQCTIGDIVKVNGDKASISLNVDGPVGIVAVELRTGDKAVKTVRTYAAADLGHRIRVVWSGAEYRGRGRNTNWRGRADIRKGSIERFAPINKLNPEMPLHQVGSQSVVWDCVTTGNMMGFDAWLSAGASSIDIVTALGNTTADVQSLGVEPQIMEAGGLSRKLVIQRMPNHSLPTSVEMTADVEITEAGDTPVWICVTFEDGNQAWTSPIYLHRD